jgi:ABC-type polysaccharide/polyol phosphate export permease
VITIAKAAPRRSQRARPSGWRHKVDVLVALMQSDLRSRYGRGPWRMVKWLLDPFALTGVYLILVTVVLDRGGRAAGLSLACAVVPFHLVMTTIINALGALQLRSSIILNMAFDRVLIPVSSALTETVAFAASLNLIVLMMVIYGVAPTLAVVWLPVVVAVNIVLAVGFAYAASLAGLWFSDLRPFAVSFVRAMFFLAPGVVPLSEVGGRTSDLLRLNPLTGIFEAYRSVLVYGHRPSAWQLLYPLAAAALLFAVFLPLYVSEQRQFAKVV